jgi:drug/metabolite transporter (DMT)-like permease
LLVLINVFWAPVNLLVQIATADGTSPVALALTRWSITAVLLGLLLAIPRFRTFTGAKWPSRRDVWMCLAMGVVFFGPSHALYYFALGKTSTYEGVTLNTTAPIWSGLMAFLLLGEKIGALRWVAFVLGTIGAYIVSVGFQLPRLDGGHTWGNLLYLTAVIMECIGGVFVIQSARRSSGITSLFLQLMGGAIGLTLLTSLSPQTFPFRFDTVGLPTLLCLGYLILFSGIFNFSVWYVVAEKVPLSFLVLTLLLQNPLAAALGVAFRNETITPSVGVGALLVMVALVVGVFQKDSHRLAVEEVANAEGK